MSGNNEKNAARGVRGTGDEDKPKGCKAIMLTTEWRAT